MAESFEKYLFRKFKAVYVDGWSELSTSGITLLDVLTKTDAERHSFRSHPVLEKAGSMIELGSASSEETQTGLRCSLSLFEKNKGDALRLLKWTEDDQNIDKTVASSHSLTASILARPVAEAAAGISRAKKLRVKVEGLQTACADKGKLIDMIVGKHWKPDINHGRLPWSGQKKSGGNIKLWVIHQVLYASKLVIESADSASADVRAFTAVAATPGAGVGAARESGPNSDVRIVGTRSKFPGKFMFAFRALRFEFDSAGNLVEHKTHVGDVRPVTRAKEDGPYDDEREQIRDLFLEEPPEVYTDSDDEDEDGKEWDGQPLLIQEIENAATSSVLR